MASISNLNTNVTSVVVALAVAFVTSMIMVSSFKYIFSLLLFLLSFLICKILSSEKHDHHVQLVNQHYATKPFFFLSIWIFSIIVVFLVNPSDGAQYVEWNKIPLLNWLRLIAAFLCTSFYPGYAISTIIAKNEKFSFTEKITLSTFLSIFISGLIAFIATLSEGLVGNCGFLGIILLNTLLLVLFATLRKRHRKKIAEVPNFSLQLAMGILILFTLTALYVVNFPGKFVPTLDQWRHYGSVLKATDGNLFSTSGVYPYWFYMHAALFSVVSGFPSVNAFMMLLFLFAVLPILSFYLMCSSLLPDNKVSIMATVIYALFSGFGGLYTTYLNMTDGEDLLHLIGLASSKTCDIGYWLPSLRLFFFPKIIGFSTFFLCICLLRRRFSNRYVKISFIATFFALGYLAHISEALLFILIMPFILMFLKDFLKDPTDLPISVGLGLLLVSFMDLLAPQKVYVFRSALYTPLFLCGLLVWMLLSFIILRFELNRKIFAKAEGIRQFFKRFSPILVVALVYIYILCLIIWSYEIPLLSLSWGTPVPWYVYPIRLGMAGFIVVASIPWLVKQRNSVGLRFPLLLVILFLLFGKALSYLSILRTQGLMIPMPLAESRVMEFTWVGVSILASYSIVKVFRHVCHMKVSHPKVVKTFLATFTLSLMMITGVSSTLYGIELRSQPTNTTSTQELESIDFFRSNSLKQASVIAPSLSTYKLDSFGGRPTVHQYYRPAFFSAERPESFFDILTHNIYQTSNVPINYLFISNRDLNEIKDYPNSFLFNHLTQYLPILLTNEETAIYEIPPFAPPSQASNLTILIPSSPTEITYLYPLETVSLAQLNYTLSLDFDPKLFTYSTIILTYDPEETNLNNYLPWLSKGGTLIVYNSLGSHGSFASLLSLNITETDETFEVNGILGPDGEITMPQINTPIFSSKDENVTSIAFYTKDGDFTSPYAFHKRIGTGELVYVEVNPYFKALQLLKGCDAGRRMFAKLGKLLNILGLPQLEPADFSKPTIRAVLYGQTDLIGKVTLKPSSFYIPAMDSKFMSTIGWKKDNFTQGWSVATNNPANGTIYVTPDGNVTQVTFNATSTEVWQYFYVEVPNVDVSKFRYLILREKIEINSYHLGHLRVIINGNTYVVRGWTSETWTTGHGWKTYIFDLNEAVPCQEGAPTPPKGSITQIFWTGCSRGTEGGSGELYLNSVRLCSLPIYVPDLGEHIASIDFSHVDECRINGSRINVPPKLQNVKVLNFQLKGGFETILTGSKVQLTPTELGVYSKGTFSGGFNCTILLSNDAVAHFTLMDENEVFNLTACGGYFNMSVSTFSKDLIVYMTNVHIAAEGLTRFEKAFISTPYKVLCLNFPMKVSGHVSFDVNSSDENFVSISNLTVDGEYIVFIQSEAVQLNEWDIPWAPVFVSPYHILLVTCISIVLIIYYWRKRKQT